MRYFYIAILGLAGIFLRYGISVLCSRFWLSTFPLATFCINILGSLLIGITYGLGAEKMAISEDLRIGIMVGFLGGFTTFSSFSLESALLLNTSQISIGAFYFFISPLVCLAASFAGIYWTRIFL